MKQLRARHLSHFAKLPRDQRQALLTALFLIPGFSVALRVLGFTRCYAWVGGASTRPTGRDVVAARRYARLVIWAAQYGAWSGNCLSQSLALARLLRWQGIDAQLRIGAQRNGEKLAAHAWVEVDGAPLNDTADVARRFPPFGELHHLTLASFV